MQSHANLQNWYRVVLEVRYLPFPCGGGKSRRVTPRVIVESKEVSSFISSAAVHVVGSFETVIVDVCSGISNRDGPVTTSTNVLLHVTRYSLDIRSTRTSVDAVDILVSRKEQKCVVVFLELIDGGEDVLQVDMVVGLRWLILSKGVFWRIDIQGQVYSGSLECGHTCIMVLAVVNGVDSNSVDVQLLKPISPRLAKSRKRSHLKITHSLMSREQMLISESGSAASEDPPG